MSIDLIAGRICFLKLVKSWSFCFIPSKHAVETLDVSAQGVGLVAGYPCCGVSAQNPNPQSFRDKGSSTGGGYHATMRYVQNSPQIQWVLLENVQQMFHTRRKFGNEKPMDIQTAAMKKLGFGCAFALLLNSSEFGLCQSRARAWVLYVRGTNVRLGYWSVFGLETFLGCDSYPMYLSFQIVYLRLWKEQGSLMLNIYTLKILIWLNLWFVFWSFLNEKYDEIVDEIW